MQKINTRSPSCPFCWSYAEACRDVSSNGHSASSSLEIGFILATAVSRWLLSGTLYTSL